MAFENLCMYCFEENGGADVCPHCGRDARAAVPQIQLLPGTLVYNERFLIGRALGQDASGIVYAALDTKKNVKIRIREYLPRDCARRLNSGEVVPEPGAEDQFDSGMNKLRASVEGVEDPSKRHFFFEENGTGYIAQRKNSGGAVFGGSSDEEGDHRGARMAMVVGLAAVLVLAVAVGVIALVNYFTSSTDRHTEAPATTAQDIWEAPASPTPTPYAAATFAAITDPTHSWMDFTNPDLSGNASDYATPTPAPTPQGGLGTTINANSDPETIEKLQKLLVNLGWLDESGVTGKYDGATKQAVMDFQQYMNDTFAIDPKLTVDGIAGQKTLTWLLKTDISMKPTPTPAPVTPSPTQAGKVIDENSSAEEIKYVQVQLMRLGILSSDDVDGKYGNATKNGVKAFQIRVNDLLGYDAVNEDGICDDRTLAYLDYYVDWWEKNQPTAVPTQTPKATATPTAAPTTNEATGEVIDENSNKSSIKRVQEMLITLGYLEGTADGVYGNKTYAAVKAFQQDLKDNVDSNVQVTGKCDILTREYLERYSDEASMATTPEPAAKAPQITVSGAQSYENGLYVVGESGVRITWTAENTANYCVELIDQDDNMINKEASTPYTSLTLYQNNLSADQPYKFVVTALNSDGSRGESAFVWVLAAVAGGEPTAEPAAIVPEITVTGALSYSEGVYRIGADGAGLAWYADGAEAYSLYISDSSGEVIYSRQNIEITEYELDAADMTPGEKYTFSVVAIPEGGIELDGESASVRLVLDAQAVTPEPTVEPSTNFSAPVIKVEALGEMDGVYYVGDTAALISWYAEGDVRAYSIYLTNSNGDRLSSLTETDKQSMTVDPATMTAEELYTITVVAIPNDGYEEHGKSSQVQIMLYTGQTPEPTAEPIAEIGQIGITVSGHTANEGNTYYAGKDGMTVAWNADGDVAGYDVLIVDSNGEVIIDREGVTGTSMTVSPDDLVEDVAYTFTVTAVPKGGTAEDGNSASVVIVRASAPELGNVVISVTGQAAEDEGVYYIGNEPLVIEWASENAVAYNIYLSNSDDEVIKSVENTTETTLKLGSDGFEAAETYILTVEALSVTGEDADSRTASIFITKMEEEKPQLGLPEIVVSGHIDVNEGVYIVDESGVNVSWSAENAVSYNVAIFDAENEKIKAVDGTVQKSMDIDTAALTANKVFTIVVMPVGEDGETGEYTSVQLMRMVAEPTPEPTPEPVEIGMPDFVVSGHLDEMDGIYVIGNQSVNVSWIVENAELYNVYVYDSSNKVLTSAEQKAVTNMDVNPASMPVGEVVTIAVSGIGADGTEGETGYVQLIMPEAEATPEPTPEPTAEPTPEPVEIGMPVINVSGHIDEADGLYMVGDEDITITWSAENAVAYDVAIYNGDGEVVKSANGVTTTTLELTSSGLTENEVFTLAVAGLDAEGVRGDIATIQLVRESAGGELEPITPDSDADTIKQLQVQLYSLGWITEENKSMVEIGVLDSITIQAVYEFQTYVIDEGINPEVSLIDANNPVIDEVTITALFDTEYPVYRPQ